MPTTTCTECGSLYEAGSEEQANEPKRSCRMCTQQHGERLRIQQALYRLEAVIFSMRTALNVDAPIGSEAPQALLTTAGEIMTHSAAADAVYRARRKT